MAGERGEEQPLLRGEAAPLPWTICAAAIAACRFCDQHVYTLTGEERPRWMHLKTSKIACSKPGPDRLRSE